MLAILSNPQFWIILFVLVGLTNLIAQLIKKVTWDKLPTNWLVLIVAVLLSEAAIFVYCQLSVVAYLVSYAIIGLILGLLVAYGAMFGYDKLKEALEALKQIKADK